MCHRFWSGGNSDPVVNEAAASILCFWKGYLKI
jgi:hypothetical protein